MKFLQLLVLFSLLTLQSCLAEDKKEFDKEEEAHGIKVKVLQKSGRITIRQTKTKKNQGVKDAVEIVMDELSEYVDNTTKVNKTMHSFKGFSSKMFAFTDTAEKKYKDISAKTFNFTATINNSTNLTVTVTIFNNSGNITNGNEKIEVKEGMVKTDISIGNWVFCNHSCTSNNKTETGNILQFKMTIKGKSYPVQNPAQNGQKSALSYDIGENVTLVLSKKYKDNASWKGMESGYPKLVPISSKKSFLFRFKKFNGTVFYDGISVYRPKSTDENGDDSSAGAIIKVSVLLMVISLFINLIYSIF